jgi:hypothetical protein
MAFDTTETKYSIMIDLSNASPWEKRIISSQIQLMKAQIQALYDLKVTQ